MRCNLSKGRHERMRNWNALLPEGREDSVHISHTSDSVQSDGGNQRGWERTSMRDHGEGIKLRGKCGSLPKKSTFNHLPLHALTPIISLLPHLLAEWCFWAEAIIQRQKEREERKLVRTARERTDTSITRNRRLFIQGTNKWHVLRFAHTTDKIGQKCFLHTFHSTTALSRFTHVCAIIRDQVYPRWNGWEPFSLVSLVFLLNLSLIAPTWLWLCICVNLSFKYLPTYILGLGYL